MTPLPVSISAPTSLAISTGTATALLLLLGSLAPRGEADIYRTSPTYIERLGCLLRQHVEDLFRVGGAVRAPQVLVAAAQLGSDVIQGDVLVTVALRERETDRKRRGENQRARFSPPPI